MTASRISSLPACNSLESKQCMKCGETYPLEFYSRVTKTTRKCFTDGRLKTCRSCRRLVHAESRERHGTVGAIASAHERNRVERWLLNNPDEAWCAAGEHFVKAVQMAQSTTRKSGHNSKCRECVAKYYEANVTDVRAKASDWYYKNRDRARETRKEYSANLPVEKKQEYRRRHYHRHKEQKAAYKRLYTAKNWEKVAEQARRYYEQEKERYRANRQTTRAVKYQTEGSFTKDQWLAKCEYYGFCCYLCRTSLADVIINAEHRIPFSRGGTNWLSNVAPACQTCNLKKGQMTEQEYRASLPP